MFAVNWCISRRCVRIHPASHRRVAVRRPGSGQFCHRGRRRDRRSLRGPGGPLRRAACPASTGSWRSAPDRCSTEDGRRNRTIGRPGLQHLQSRPANLWARLDSALRGIITRMGEQAQSLFIAAIESYVENDAAKAAAIDDMDSFLDALAQAIHSGDLRKSCRGQYRLCRLLSNWLWSVGSTSALVTTL